ncbi:MAG: AtpZ/AtpI family protein [Bacteroidales bacterium]|nr:AtpZ/AtpI family protein [Bacteroidales bacterium]
MNQKKDDKQRLRLIAKYTSAAFQMAAIIVLGAFLGRYLDNTLDTKPILTIIILLVSVFAALYFFIKDITKK